MVDTISDSAHSTIATHEWGVDVSVAGSQKGLMLPPGLSFNAVSDKALAPSKASRLPKSYWGWDEIIAMNRKGCFPYTPATNTAVRPARSYGDAARRRAWTTVFARHDRHAEATRRAVRALGPRDPAAAIPLSTAAR